VPLLMTGLTRKGFSKTSRANAAGIANVSLIGLIFEGKGAHRCAKYDSDRALRDRPNSLPAGNSARKFFGIGAESTVSKRGDAAFPTTCGNARRCGEAGNLSLGSDSPFFPHGFHPAGPRKAPVRECAENGRQEPG